MRKVCKEKTNKLLMFFYDTKLGRILLKPIVCNNKFSNFIAWFMNRKISTIIINSFIKNSDINMDDYEHHKYASFNDFFTRKIIPSKRKINLEQKKFISPCDAKLTCYKINDNLLFNVKKSTYSINSILNDEKIARQYKNGYAMVFRLSPYDYHRYCFIDDGTILDNYKIKGMFHTVNPIVYDKFKVFKENSRECTLIKTNNFGIITYIEVGALLVGKIKNLKDSGKFYKGEEKGFFEYGGSTIILLVKSNKIKIDNDILNNSKNGLETIVKYGEKIAYKL